MQDQSKQKEQSKRMISAENSEDKEGIDVETLLHRNRKTEREEREREVKRRRVSKCTCNVKP